jgi:hypothetical protein
MCSGSVCTALQRVCLTALQRVCLHCTLPLRSAATRSHKLRLWAQCAAGLSHCSLPLRSAATRSHKLRLWAQCAAGLSHCSLPLRSAATRSHMLRLWAQCAAGLSHCPLPLRSAATRSHMLRLWPGRRVGTELVDKEVVALTALPALPPPRSENRANYSSRYPSPVGSATRSIVDPPF